MNNNIFTVEKENGVVEWNLNSECRRVVQRIANEFGMSIVLSPQAGVARAGTDHGHRFKTNTGIQTCQ